MTKRRRMAKHRRTTPKDSLMVPQPFSKKKREPEIVGKPQVFRPERILDEREERLAELEIEEARLEVECDKLEKRRKNIAKRRADYKEKEWALALKIVNQELEGNRFALDRVREKLRTVREELAH